MIKLVVGGARSGKSKYAESLVKDNDDVVYMATSRITDMEMKERVEHHRSTRPSTWRTFEQTYDLVNAIGEEKNYLLDCVTVLASNIMFDMTKDYEYISSEIQLQVEEKVVNEIYKLMDAVEERGYYLIIVSNEVGYSIVPEHHVSRVFRDIQGRVNQRAALRANEVYLVCCGIPVKIK